MRHNLVALDVTSQQISQLTEFDLSNWIVASVFA
jgi:hypothetical protein